MTLNFAQSLDDLLADPIIQMVMKADHVEAGAVREMMTKVASGRPARPLAFNPESVRFGTEARPGKPVRLGAPAGYKGGESRLCC